MRRDILHHYPSASMAGFQAALTFAINSHSRIAEIDSFRLPSHSVEKCFHRSAILGLVLEVSWIRRPPSSTLVFIKVL